MVAEKAGKMHDRLAETVRASSELLNGILLRNIHLRRRRLYTTHRSIVRTKASQLPVHFAKQPPAHQKITTMATLFLVSLLLAHIPDSGATVFYTLGKEPIVNRAGPKCPWLDDENEAFDFVHLSHRLAGYTKAPKCPWYNEGVIEEEEDDEWIMSDTWWEDDWSRDDLKSYWNCASYMRDTVLPIHNETAWWSLRQIYRDIVGVERSTIEPLSHESGFFRRVELKHFEGKGRGVVAKERIEKGQLVWSDRQTACFQDGSLYRKFLASVSPEMACEIMAWAYLVDQTKLELLGKWDFESDDDFWEYDISRTFMCVDLDEGSLINTGNVGESNHEDEEVDADVNIHLTFDRTGIDPNLWSLPLIWYAARDIEEGEEILADYADFDIDEGWVWFGL